MKKLLVAIFAIALFSSLSFAQIHDNTGPHSAQSSFSLTVWLPLGITASQPVDLGIFVQNTTEYPVTGTLTFNVTGDPEKTVYWKHEESVTGTGSATIHIDWAPGSSPLTLNVSGNATITASATGVIATSRGTVTYTETVTVSYNTI
jgi:hypothetical protein